jgi:uncharacterized protein YjbJ (UPF0337 family)
MNENVLTGSWNQLKGEVKKQWGELTNDDVDRINGNYDQLVGIVQERYGLAKADAQSQIADWLDSTVERLRTKH